MRYFKFRCILCIIGGILLLAGFSCQKQDADRYWSMVSGGKPYEQFFIQRAFPEMEFPVRGYIEAMAYSRRMVSLRQEPPVGFDGTWVNPVPPNFSGRVNAVAVHPTDESILYAGLASGGVFKTVDAGQTWTPIFDDRAYLAIGAVSLEPGNPEVVYVGTGDPNVTGYPFLGDGLYRSENGGASWEYLGLKETRIISNILIHPTNPNIIWAGCLGLPLKRNSDRGVYKSTDRGKTWRKVLFLSEQAGVTDMIADPFDPNNLYVAFWDRIRTNRESVSTGPNSRIYKSSDGGESWVLCTTGLPAGTNLGRIALASSGVTPGRIFARIVGEDQELDNIYRSDDYGQNWEPIIDWKVSNLGRTGALGNAQFGWYFGRFAVNPDNDFELYLLGIDLWRTKNGGRNWELAAPSWRQYIVHADKHELLFSPSGTLFLSTDGGLYKKPQTEENWSMVGALPGLQFFRVGYNPHAPDTYYGGTQDNGTLQGKAGVEPWKRLYPNDGFTTLFHPVDPNVVYVQMQYGRKFVSQNKGETWVSASQGILDFDRMHWDSPFVYSSHYNDLMYTGSYRVYKSTSGKIPQWYAISPDLTDGNIYGNPFHTITSISESPRDQHILYAGTTDGNLWRTTGGGGIWTPIQSGLPNRYITSVHASPDFTDNVYVTYSGYRDNEFLPYVFRSRNKGTTWENISNNLPPIGVNDLLVLPGHRDSILFAATDGGVYASKNAGQAWYRLGQNLPQVAFYDLEWNKQRQLLLAGSFGRSIFAYSIDAFLNGGSVRVKELPFSKESLMLYPNPASETLHLTWQGLEIKTAKLQIFSSTGQLCSSSTIDLQERDVEIRIQQLPAGTYLLTLRGAGGIISKPFVKL